MLTGFIVRGVDPVTKAYWLLRNERLPEPHRAAYRVEGIDPDNMWDLIWSFDSYEAAEKMMGQAKGRSDRYPELGVRYRIVYPGDAYTQANAHCLDFYHARGEGGTDGTR